MPAAIERAQRAVSSAPVGVFTVPGGISCDCSLREVVELRFSTDDAAIRPCRNAHAHAHGFNLRRASVQDIVGKWRGAQDSNRGQDDAKRAPIAARQSITQQKPNPGTQNPARRSDSE